MGDRRRLRVLQEGAAPVGRRELLQWMGAIAASSTIGGCYTESGTVVPPPGFLTLSERSALAALANAVFPPDDQPGGADLGVVDYVNGLLSAFDSMAPMLYAGGPYSGRQPFADPLGNVSTEYPSNDFLNFQPLDRTRDAAWRLHLFGSTGVAGGSPNDATLGRVTGLRDQVRQGLAAAMHGAAAPLDTLSQDELAGVFRKLDVNFRNLLIELVAEAAFSAPEYGGNPNLAGWKMVHFEGDSQPLGYSLYDASLGAYRERPDAPLTTANPGPDPDPMDSDTHNLIAQLFTFAGGKVFQ
jgi:hypothetical protein